MTLKEKFLVKLRESCLTEADGRKLGFDILTTEQLSKLHITDYPAPGFRLPYYDINRKQTKFFRFRYLEEPKLKEFDALIQPNRKPIRYIQPAGQEPRVYFSPMADWKELLKSDVPLFVTEGELKAACGVKMGIPVMGLGGVWNFQSAEDFFISDLEQFSWAGRAVYIVFDSDAATNGSVMLAERRFAGELLKRGAVPTIVRLPGEFEKKVGLDDFLRENGTEAFHQLLISGAAEPFEEAQELHRMNEKVVLVESLSKILERRDNHFLSRHDFERVNYADWIWTEKLEAEEGKPTPRPRIHRVATEWLEWLHKARVRRITYEPGKPRMYGGLYNCFNGLAVEPRKGDVRPWTELLNFLFSEVPREDREWFERWVAYPLQHLGTKMLTAVLFYGVPTGTGKTIIGKTLMKIYGENGANIESGHLTNHFNSWKINKMFVMGDEIIGGDKRFNADLIKSLITDTTTNIERKYQEEYEAPNYIQFYFTSNHPDALFLEDSDRRFFVHHVSVERMDRSFYIEYERWKESPEGPAALLYYLLHLPLGDFDPSAPARLTVAKQQMIESVRSEAAAWVHRLKTDPDGVLKVGGVTLGWTLATNDELLSLFSQDKGKLTNQGMGREMARAGFVRAHDGNQIRTSNGLRRLWILRDREKIQQLSIKATGELYGKEHGDGTRKF